MRTIKKSEIKRMVLTSYHIGTCNMKCSYCYVWNQGDKIQEIPWSLEQIKKAFSKKRLGGTCIINICADGEPLIHPMMPDIIKAHLEEGHYVMVVTNGVSTVAIKKILTFDEKLLARIFFKISFHYEEMTRLNLLEKEYSNINLIKQSPCSFSLEYTVTDSFLDDKARQRKMRQECIEKVGALPHLNIPRDSRKFNLNILSGYSWDNYMKKCEELNYDSNFYKFRKQIFGKKYRDFCYSGMRNIWIDMEKGTYNQCYHTTKTRDFMKNINKPLKFIPIGNCCDQAHCYSGHLFMTIGITPPPQTVKYRPNHYDIRSRIGEDGFEWIKPEIRKVFECGVEEKECNRIEKMLFNTFNKIMSRIERNETLKKERKCKK